jgi:hypothetical protein
VESEHTEPEMRPFVMSLLVAATGDTRTVPRSRDLVHNAAFRYSVELVAELPGACRRALAGDGRFGGWIDSSASREDFFLFCGALLDAVDARVRGRHAALASEEGDQPSSYDHAALLALGQTLCRAAGVKRASLPPFETCLRAIAGAQPQALQERLLTNYLGNVLQDYFDAAEIRASQVSLPVTIEESLREEEAADLSRAVFAAIVGGDGPVDVTLLQEELQDIVGRVWIAQKELGA